MESVSFLEQLPENIKSTVETVHIVEEGRNPSVIVRCKDGRAFFVKCASNTHICDEANLLTELNQRKFSHLLFPRLIAQTSALKNETDALLITSYANGKMLTKDEAIAKQQKLLTCLVELHQVDYKEAGLDHIAKGEGYIQRQIDGWSERYQKAKTWNVPSGKFVINWLKNNMPEQETICLTHNDFRFDNVVLDPDDYTKVLGVLDWELATLGDPLMDLGNTLAYWVEPEDDFLAQATRRQPTHLKGMLTRKEVVDYYCEKMDIKVDDFTFYEVYGLFRLAGIVQQIYYRYHHGQTKNPAFKNFWIFVHYLLRRCKKAIKAQGRK